jgi:hypothetical protein
LILTSPGARGEVGLRSNPGEGGVPASRPSPRKRGEGVRSGVAKD